MSKSCLLSMQEEFNLGDLPKIRMRWMILPDGLEDLANIQMIQDKRLRHGQSGAELTIVEFSISDHTDQIDVTPKLGAPQQFIPGMREVELDITFNLLSIPNTVSWTDADFFTDFHVVI